jgi:2-polyprenyl-3-methyl-5-hydroxy-6-metoxy-1,4-benzoquinol methylase
MDLGAHDMDHRFVEQLSLAEVKVALMELYRRKSPGSTLMEIGGGAGWQARALADAGYAVRSFDLPNSEFSGTRVFAIEDYDGRHIPADDASFEIAFSSNVLEHIADAEAFQKELHRWAEDCSGRRFGPPYSGLGEAAHVRPGCGARLCCLPNRH